MQFRAPSVMITYCYKRLHCLCTENTIYLRGFHQEFMLAAKLSPAGCCLEKNQTELKLWLYVLPFQVVVNHPQNKLRQLIRQSGADLLMFKSGLVQKDSGGNYFKRDRTSFWYSMQSPVFISLTTSPQNIQFQLYKLYFKSATARWNCWVRTKWGSLN